MVSGLLQEKEESPMYCTYDESIGLHNDTLGSNKCLAHRFYSENNIKFLKRRAKFIFRHCKDSDIREDDLIDETFARISQNDSTGVEKVLYKDDEEFQNYEVKTMRAVYQSDWGSKEDSDNKISYSRKWEALEMKFDGEKAECSIDRSEKQQMAKGDGLDFVLTDIPSLVDECKGEYAECGFSYLLIIGVMCVFHETCNGIKSQSQSDAQASISPLLQSVFSLSQAQIQFMYSGIRNNPSLLELVHEGFKEPEAVIERIKGITRCSIFFDKAEQLVKEQIMTRASLMA